MLPDPSTAIPYPLSQTGPPIDSAHWVEPSAAASLATKISLRPLLVRLIEGPNAAVDWNPPVRQTDRAPVAGSWAIAIAVAPSEPAPPSRLTQTTLPLAGASLTTKTSSLPALVNESEGPKATVPLKLPVA